MDIREQIHALSDEMLENLGKLVAIDSTLGTPSEDKPFGEGPAKALEAGLEIAERTYERHTVLSQIFELLGVDKDIATADACKIEHVISNETFSALKKHFHSNLKNK